MRSDQGKGSVGWVRGVLAVSAAVGWLALPSLVLADNVITDCGQSCEDDCGTDPNCREAAGGKCILEADVSCDSTESTILLVSGNNLDLQGWDVTCTTTGTGCIYNAIQMNDAGSKVTSDGSEDDGESEISGLFLAGVACNGKSNSIVENLTLFDGIFAVNSCKTVRNNVIGSSSQFLFGGNIGIFTTGISNADSFTDNYISGRTVPILSQGTTDVDVMRNVIHTDVADEAVWLGQGQTAAGGLIKFNVFFGVGPDSSAVLIKMPATDDGTYDGNLCDEDHPDCADCISDGRCEPFASPFPGN